MDELNLGKRDLNWIVQIGMNAFPSLYIDEF